MIAALIVLAFLVACFVRVKGTWAIIAVWFCGVAVPMAGACLLYALERGWL